MSLVFCAAPQDPSVASRFAVCPRQEGNDPHFSVLSPHKDAAWRREVVSPLKYFVCRFVTRVPCLIVGAQHAAPLLGKIAPTRRLSCVLPYSSGSPACRTARPRPPVISNGAGRLFLPHSLLRMRRPADVRNLSSSFVRLRRETASSPQFVWRNPSSSF